MPVTFFDVIIEWVHAQCPEVLIFPWPHAPKLQTCCKLGRHHQTQKCNEKLYTEFDSNNPVNYDFLFLFLLTIKTNC